jgi:hypothetical protein
MNYGEKPDAYLLYNTGDGHFKEANASIAPMLQKIGFITNAIQADINGDGQKEIILTHQWGGIDILYPNPNGWKKGMVTSLPGWWNFTLAVDVDGDGDLDLIAGNLGLNTRLKASKEQPIRMYYNDFDDNGKKEQIVSFYLQNKELPFANKDEIQRQIPKIKKSFLYAEDFAKASLADIFTKEKLNTSEISEAYHFANTVFINDGKGNFTPKELPWEAQITAYKTAAICDANGDQLPDLLLMGNFYDNNVQMGRYDADYGTLLLNKGKGAFEALPFNGLVVKGQVRKMSPLQIGSSKAFVLGMNSDSLRIIQFSKSGNK